LLVVAAGIAGNTLDIGLAQEWPIPFKRKDTFFSRKASVHSKGFYDKHGDPPSSLQGFFPSSAFTPIIAGIVGMIKEIFILTWSVLPGLYPCRLQAITRRNSPEYI
jgi:hypothetical protein